jgi:hypothetical protein
MPGTKRAIGSPTTWSPAISTVGTRWAVATLQA